MAKMPICELTSIKYFSFFHYIILQIKPCLRIFYSHTSTLKYTKPADVPSNKQLTCNFWCLHLHRTLIVIELSGNGTSVTWLQPLHVNSAPLSVFSKVTIFTPLSSADVILVVPLYHWYFAAGFDLVATHVKDSGFPDITLIDETYFVWLVGVKDTLSTGTAKIVERT